MRCTGKHPCAHCTAVNAPCEYNAKYTRGKAPTIQTASQHDQAKYLAALGWKPGMSSGRRKSPDRSSSERSSPEPVQQRRAKLVSDGDDEPQSGASIFRRTQNNLNRLTRPVSHSQRIPVSAFGDPVFPDVDYTFLVLPPQEVAKDLIAKYFEVVAPINQFLHHPTVNKWLNEVLKSFQGGHEVQNSRRAIVLLVIASAYNFTEATSNEGDSLLRSVNLNPSNGKNAF